MKRLLSLNLILVMLLGMLPATAMAAESTQVGESGYAEYITMDGTQYDASSEDRISGDGWTYQGGILTLTGYHGGAIETNVKLTVFYDGVNTVTAKSGHGISATAKLTLRPVANGAEESSLAVYAAEGYHAVCTEDTAEIWPSALTLVGGGTSAISAARIRYGSYWPHTLKVGDDAESAVEGEYTTQNYYAIELIPCYMTLYGNGGTTENGEESYRFQVDFTTGTGADLFLYDQQDVFAQDGKEQVGWGINPEGTGTTYSHNNGYSYANGNYDASLYALWNDTHVEIRRIWENTYGSVTWTSDLSDVVKIGGKYVLPNVNREGYTLDGWRGDDGVLYAANTSVAVTRSATYTAEYTPVNATASKLMFRQATWDSVNGVYYEDETKALSTSWDANIEAGSLVQFYFGTEDDCVKVGMDELTTSDGVYLYEQDGFVWIRGSDFGAQKIIYTDAEGAQYTMPVNIGLPPVSFYSQPEASEKTYIGQYAPVYISGENNVFYVAATAGYSVFDVVLNVSFDAFADVEVAEDGSYAKITVTESFADGRFGMQITYGTDKWNSTMTRYLMLYNNNPKLMLRHMAWDSENKLYYENESYDLQSSWYNSINAASVVKFYYGTKDQYAAVSLDELSTDGDIKLSAYEGGFILMEPAAFGEHEIYYTAPGGVKYTLPATVTLPSLGFYSAPEATEKGYLDQKFTVSGEDNAFYLVPLNCTLTKVNLNDQLAEIAEVEIAEDGSYAKITVNGTASGGWYSLKAELTSDGWSWTEYADLRISDGNPHLAFRGMSWGENGWYENPNEAMYGNLTLHITSGRPVKFYFVTGEDCVAVSLDELTVSGSGVALRSEEDHIRIIAEQFGTWYIGYTAADGVEYRLPVTVSVPAYAFYSAPIASVDNYITEFGVTDESKTFYMISAKHAITAVELEPELAKIATVEVAKDGSYAAITVTGAPNGRVYYAQAYAEDANGNSFSGQWGLRIYDNTTHLMFRQADWTPDTGWYDNPDMGMMTNWGSEINSSMPGRFFFGTEESYVPVSLKQLSVSGDGIELGGSDEMAWLACMNEGVYYVTYTADDGAEYTFRVVVHLPALGFYTEPKASGEYYTSVYTVTKANEVLYLVPSDGTLTKLALGESLAKIAEAELAADGSYAAIIITGTPEGSWYDVTATYETTKGSWTETAQVRLENGIVEVPEEPEEPDVTVEVVDEGQCGDDLYWTVAVETDAKGNSQVVLSFDGSGEMEDYTSSDPDWFPFNDEIQEIRLSEKQTSIGAYAFGFMDGIYSIVIPASVKSIGGGAFAQCVNLHEVIFEGDAPVIGDYAFSNVTAACLYPEGNDSWTTEVMANYGGTLEWVAYDAGTGGGDSGKPHLMYYMVGRHGDDSWVDLGYGMEDAWYFDGTYLCCQVVFCFGTEDNWVPVDFNQLWATDSKAVELTDRGYTGEGYSVVDVSVFAFGDYSICYKDTDGTVYSMPVYVYLPSVGFFSTPVMSEDSYLHQFVLTETNRTFYLVSNEGDIVDVVMEEEYVDCTEVTIKGNYAAITFTKDPAYTWCWPYLNVTIDRGEDGYGEWGLSLDVLVGEPDEPEEPEVPEISASGTCGMYGDNLTWTLEDGVLTVSGYGEMMDCSGYAAPWNAYYSNIKEVVVEEGVTTIGPWAFAYCEQMTKVTLPETLNIIDYGAFVLCTALTEVTIPANVTLINSQAFTNCTAMTKVIFRGDAPKFNEDMYPGLDSFANVVADCYYPADNTTWTADVMLNYGGDNGLLTWMPYTGEIEEPDVPEEPQNGQLMCYHVGENAEGKWADMGWGMKDILGGDGFGHGTVVFCFGTEDNYIALEYSDLWVSDDKAVVLTEWGDTVEGYSAIDVAMYSFGDYSIYYKHTDGTVYSMPVSVYLPDIGFFISPVISEKTYIHQFNLTETNRTFYLVSNRGDITHIELNDGFADCTEVTVKGNYVTITFTEIPDFTEKQLFVDVYIDKDGTGVGEWSAGRGVQIVVDESGGDVEEPDVPSDDYAVSDLYLDAVGGEVFLCWDAPKTAPEGEVWYVAYFSYDGGETWEYGIGAGGCDDTSVSLTDMPLAWYHNEEVTTAFKVATEVDGVEVAECIASLILSVEDQQLQAAKVTVTAPETEGGKYTFEVTGLTPNTDIWLIGQRSDGGSVSHSHSDEEGTCTFTWSSSRMDAYLADATSVYLVRELVGASAAKDGLSATYTIGNCGDWASLADAVNGGTDEPEKPESIAEGWCGDDLYWILTSDGVLTISGTGAMYDYGDPAYPAWHEYYDMIRCVCLSKEQTSIGAHAFDELYNVTSFTVPDSVTSIGEMAFANCSALKNISLGSGLKSIGRYAFIRCDNLTELTIPGSMERIAQETFSGASLKKVTLEEGVQVIGEGAFTSCATLTEIVIPDSLHTVEYGALGGCSSLTEIRFGSGLQVLGDWALGECESLTGIWFEGDAPSMMSDTFYGVTATGYYPADNDTWTEDVMQNYGGSLTWKSYGAGGVIEPEVTVVFDLNTDDENVWGDLTPVTVTSGETVRLPVRAEDFDRAYYVFKGWFTKPEGGEQVTDETPITDDCVLYAQWELRTTVTLILYVSEITGTDPETGEYVGDWVEPGTYTVTLTSPDGVAVPAEAGTGAHEGGLLFRDLVAADAYVLTITRDGYKPYVITTQDDPYDAGIGLAEMGLHSGGVIFSTAGIWEPDSGDEPEQPENGYAVTNLRFDYLGNGGLPFLYWTVPSGVEGDLRYNVHVSTDSGETWTMLSSTSQDLIDLTGLDAAVYNAFKVETKLDGKVLAECSAKLTLTVTQGKDLSAATVVVTAPESEDGDYDFTVSGLTPGAWVTFTLKHTGGHTFSGSNADSNGMYFDRESYDNMSRYLADSTSAYMVKEYSDGFIAEDGLSAAYTVSNRGDWASLADAVEGDIPDSGDEETPAVALSNLRFENQNGSIFLVWDTAVREDVTENLAYIVYYSTDGGTEWHGVGASVRENKNMASMTEGTYNAFKVAVKLDGVTYELVADLSLTITRGSSLDPATVVIAPCEGASGYYSFNITGLTPDNFFLITLKCSDRMSSDTGTSDSSGAGTTSGRWPQSEIQVFLDDTSSTYLVEEIHDMWASEDGQVASFTVSNRGDWASLADAVNGGGAGEPDEPDEPEVPDGEYGIEVWLEMPSLIATITGPDTQSGPIYSYYFYNTEDPDVFDGLGAMPIGAWQPFDFREGTYNAWRVLLTEDESILGEGLLAKPIIATKDAFEHSAVTLTKGEYSAENGGWAYTMDGLDLANYTYTLETETTGYYIYSDTVYAEEDAFDKGAVLYAQRNRETDEAFLQEVSCGLTLTLEESDEPKEDVLTRAGVCVAIVDAMGWEYEESMAVSFDDLSEDHEAYEAIAILAYKGIVTGIEGKFNPDSVLSREQLAVILCKVLEEESVLDERIRPADVPATSWSAGWICTALNQGLMTTDANNNFRPADSALVTDADFSKLPEIGGDDTNEVTGQCGDNLFWALKSRVDENGENCYELIITGTGAMYEFSYKSLPGWWDYKEQIKWIELPEGLTSVGAHAFENCYYVTELTIPDSVESVGDDAFVYMSCLEKLELGSGLKTIGRAAFYGCGKSLKEVVIPDSVTYIGVSAFAGCDVLEKVTLGSGLITIDAYAFQYDECLTEIVIPDSVTTIGYQAFDQCTALEKVTFGSGVTEIGGYAFNSTNLTELTIPEGVSVIESGAFQGCKFTEVTIPAGVTKINSSAFGYCYNLVGVTFEGPAPSFISSNAFANVTAACYYPALKDGWTAEMLANYGGDLTWEPYGYADATQKVGMIGLDISAGYPVLFWTAPEQPREDLFYRVVIMDGNGKEWMRLDTDETRVEITEIPAGNYAVRVASCFGEAALEAAALETSLSVLETASKYPAKVMIRAEMDAVYFSGLNPDSLILFETDSGYAAREFADTKGLVELYGWEYSAYAGTNYRVREISAERADNGGLLVLYTTLGWTAENEGWFPVDDALPKAAAPIPEEIVTEGLEDLDEEEAAAIVDAAAGITVELVADQVTDIESGDENETVEVEIVLDVTVLGYETPVVDDGSALIGGSRALVLDIEPKAVVTTTDTDGVSSSVTQAVDTTGIYVTVKIPLPAGFASVGDNLYVIHTKDNGTRTVHAVKVQSDENGVLFVSFMNANGFSTFNVTSDVATVKDSLGNETPFDDLNKALKAADMLENGATVTMLIDQTVDGVVIPDGVTLDLADTTLTARYVVGLNGSYLTANPNSGKLVVNKGSLVLPEASYKKGEGKDGSEQYILPIWDPSQNCYLFSLFVANTHNAARGLKIDTVNETIYFQFRHLATSALNKRLLVDGASDNAVKVIVRLVWNNKDGEAHQDFVYNDEAVGKVTGDYDYSFTLTGYSALSIDIDTLSVTAMIVSDSGAIASGTVWTAEDAK